MIFRVAIRSKTVATVIKTQDIMVAIPPLNFAPVIMQTDMITLLNITTAEAPTLAEEREAARKALNTDIGTRNALPEHCRHISVSNVPGVHAD
jgi:hypothetical protein